MDNFGDEYHYWERNIFLPNEELDCWGGLDQPFSCYYDSSSPDGAAPSPASKNIMSERNRRKKLNDRLFALRAVVPNISKMDKTSIIKDAINYIQELQGQEARIQAEIAQLESGKSIENSFFDFELQELPFPLSTRSKKKRIDQQFYDSGSSSSSSSSSPIELLELRVAHMGEKRVVVSLKCSKRPDTMVKLCEVFESLKLKIVHSNITAFSGKLMKTVLVEADEEEKELLEIRIQTAIAALNDPQSPMST